MEFAKLFTIEGQQVLFTKENSPRCFLIIARTDHANGLSATQRYTYANEETRNKDFDTLLDRDYVKRFVEEANKKASGIIITGARKA